MLRITIVTQSDKTVLKAEGKVSGPWVGEFDRCFRKLRTTLHAEPTIVDLTNVSFVDADGKELIRELCRSGVEVVVTGPLMTAMLHEITRDTGQINERRCHEA